MSPDLPTLVSHAQAHGFIYPSSEIYDGLQGVYDYGPCGAALKRNLQEFWWRSMTQLENNIVGLDAAVLMEPRTWQASGHISGFHDWMVDNRDSNKRYRVDQLLEEHARHLQETGHHKSSEKLSLDLNTALHHEDSQALDALLRAQGVVCRVSHTRNWTPVRKFQLMLATQVGAAHDSEKKIYLRPETAQGIFVNFLNVQKRTRQQIPFGIAQIGKAFRNEIVLRQFTFRMREFEQMEMQFFIPPAEEEKWLTHWLAKRTHWYKVLGIPDEHLRPQPHEQLAHYARAATDLTYAFPFGWKEVEGIHARSDFDLKNHERTAKKKMTYFDPQRNESYIPFVIETSAGCDRLLLMLLTESLCIDEERTYLCLPPALAPFQAAIFPLLNKPPLAACAQQIYEELKYHFSLFYEPRGSIGKRYVRQDLIGTPYAITIDHDTLRDQTVTVRERDTMRQERVPIPALKEYLHARTSMEKLLKSLARAL